MINQRLISLLFVLFFVNNVSAQDIYNSQKDIINLPDGLSTIVENKNNKAIIAIHGYYPPYWMRIHHEWVRPFNMLVEKNYRTFFYKYDWNRCPSDVGKEFAVIITNLVSENPDVEEWDIVGHSMGGIVTMFANKSFTPNHIVQFNIIATPLYIDTNKVPWSAKNYYERKFDRCPENLNSFNNEFENGFPNHLIRWQNIKEFDSQFKKYDFNPYDREIKDSVIVQFPDSLNNERVGHTASLYFSILDIIR